MRAKIKSGPPLAARIFAGPAGWSYADWNGIVYPGRRPRGFHEAEFLSAFFDTIEINTSFYQPLRPALAELWVSKVAQNPRFLFTAKIWQKFTHEGGTNAQDEKLVRAGFDVLMRAGRLGAVLLQFPFSFHQTPENRARLESILDAFADYPLVVEVRHSSWSRGSSNFASGLRPASWAALRYLVLGRSLRASCRALQLSLLRS